MGLLDADELGGRVVVVGGLAGPDEIVGVEGAVVVVDGVELDPGVAGGGAVLVDDDVLAATGDDERAGTAEDAEGELVGHDPGRDEDGGRLPHPVGVDLLQGRHGGVLAVGVVAHLGLGHGPTHLRCRLRHGVAAQIDEPRRHGS